MCSGSNCLMRKVNLVLLSDDTFISAPKGIATEVDPEPATVAETGETIVGVHDGTQKPDRPDLYAEAYTPLFGSDGAIVGVVEVYVDETHTAAIFAKAFQTLPGWSPCCVRLCSWCRPLV